jgi:hypothetical protein
MGSVRSRGAEAVNRISHHNSDKRTEGPPGFAGGSFLVFGHQVAELPVWSGTPYGIAFIVVSTAQGSWGVFHGSAASRQHATTMMAKYATTPGDPFCSRCGSSFSHTAHGKLK